MTHPDSTVAVDGQTGHVVARQRTQLVVLVTHGSDDTRILIIDKQSLVVGGYPDVTPPVIQHVANGIVLRGSFHLWQTDHLSHPPSSHDVTTDVFLACTIHPQCTVGISHHAYLTHRLFHLFRQRLALQFTRAADQVPESVPRTQIQAVGRLYHDVGSLSWQL